MKDNKHFIEKVLFFKRQTINSLKYERKQGLYALAKTDYIADGLGNVSVGCLGTIRKWQSLPLYL